MRKFAAIVGVVAVLVATPGVVGEAAADHDDLRFGAGVRIGDFHLSIGHSPRVHDYYYRTRDRVHYDHYRCTDRCYLRGRDWYHHEACPTVLHLLHVRRVHPHALFTRYAPRYDGRFRSYDPYYHDRVNYRGGDRYYDRHDRYDDDYYDDDDRHDRGRRRSWDRGRHRGWERGRGHSGHRPGHYHGRTYCTIRH